LTSDESDVEKTGWGQVVAEQEIELIDYLRVIWKRKRLIIWGTFLAAAASLVVSVSMPNVYEVSRTMRIGQMQDVLENGKIVKGREIESREAVIDRLKDHRMLEEAVKELQLELGPQEVADLISIDRKVNPHVRYKVQSADRQMATRIADWLAVSMIKAHKPMFDSWVQAVNDYEAVLGVKINSLEAEIRRMKELIERTMRDGNADTAAAVVLSARIGDRERNLIDLKRDLQQTRLSRLGLMNTAVIAADTLLLRSVKQRIGLSMVLGGTLGLMISIFLAFFLEYVEKARGKEAAVKSEG
jgi:capsular polysaccharide biosynthesis protein